MGLFWGAHLINDPGLLMSSADQLLKWWGSGVITPHVGAVVPFSEADRAFDLIEGRESVGKVVLVPDL